MRVLTDPAANLRDAANERWERHVEALGPRAAIGLHGPGSSWTARDEYAHVARWMTVAAARVRAARDHEPPPDLDGDPNLRWQAEDRALGTEQAHRRAEQARTELLAAAASLPAGEAGDGARALAAGDLVTHLDAHFGFLVDGLLAEEQSSWDALVAQLDGPPAETSHTVDGIAWSAGDVFAHLARWFDFATASLETVRAASPMIDIPPVDERNHAWFAIDRAFVPAEARERALRARRQLLTLARAIPPAEWTAAALNRLDGNTAGHYPDHLGGGV